ncbi:MAG: gliding motility lipoprotein GldD [Marinilabiliales bacterium]|nr:MAG: gliding motility lipoprotein GldD [Marinilabiliales bacterium]
MINKIIISLLIISFFSLLSCDEAYTPKPRGYFRIDLPQKNYLLFDSVFPYAFEYPNYAIIDTNLQLNDQKYWMNLQMPQFKATLHFSYKKVDNNLGEYLEDAHTLVTKLIPKADGIYDSLIVDRKRNVFGLSYRVVGSGAASPYQFFLTDSSSHFVRAALYFNTIPNNDSLQPVIDFIESDINHIIETFEWEKPIR